jgi:hypothetical protein
MFLPDPFIDRIKPGGLGIKGGLDRLDQATPFHDRRSSLNPNKGLVLPSLPV